MTNTLTYAETCYLRLLLCVFSPTRCGFEMIGVDRYGNAFSALTAALIASKHIKRHEGRIYISELPETAGEIK